MVTNRVNEKNMSLCLLYLHCDLTSRGLDFLLRCPEAAARNWRIMRMNLISNCAENVGRCIAMERKRGIKAYLWKGSMATCRLNACWGRFQGHVTMHRTVKYRQLMDSLHFSSWVDAKLCRYAALIPVISILALVFSIIYLQGAVKLCNYCATFGVQ